jgi:hypothetical protein
MTEESFNEFIERWIVRYGTAQALADAIGMRLSAFARATRAGTLGVEQCLRLAENTREPPGRVLRLAGKGEVAELIERLYGGAPSSTAGSRTSVTWQEVLPIARESFDIWIGSPEIHWARQAWACLTGAGLTSALSPLDRLLSYVRFLVLASFYRDWCALVWDEVIDDEPENWLCGLQVNKIDVGQLLGSIVELTDDSEASLTDALLSLMEGEHRQAALTGAALRERFGVFDFVFHSSYLRTVETTDGILSAYPEEEQTLMRPSSPLRQRA